MKEINNSSRFIETIKESIRKLELDLEDLVVLTEAASGNYACTPIISALAGSEKVYAYGRDSRFGKAKDVIANIKKIAAKLEVNDKIEFITELDEDLISQADIVTNLGPLRPIGSEFINKMKETAAIPLMREPWEFREGEIDLKACKDRGIIVMGTNENHPDLLIFDYLGHLCAKKLFDFNI